MSYSAGSHVCVLLDGSWRAMCHQRHWVWIYWAINDTRVCLIEEINQLMKQGISGLRVKTCADPQTELRSSG